MTTTDANAAAAAASLPGSFSGDAGSRRRVRVHRAAEPGATRRGGSVVGTSTAVLLAVLPQR